MAYIFSKVAREGKAQGITPNVSRSAREWYRNESSKLFSRNVNANRIMNDRANIVNKISISDIGKMYMFFYDPKHKETLP
jgi:hypothetical protein